MEVIHLSVQNDYFASSALNHFEQKMTDEDRSLHIWQCLSSVAKNNPSTEELINEMKTILFAIDEELNIPY